MNTQQLNFWLANVRQARVFWSNVSRDTVAHDLDTWGWADAEKCGAIACFGGHLAAAGEFDIYTEGRTKCPRLTISKPDFDQHTFVDVEYSGHDVARYLFGKNLFVQVTDNDYFPEAKDEYDIVTCRLIERDREIVKELEQMKNETQLKQLNNVREAMKFWKTVPDQQVYSLLDSWGHRPVQFPVDSKEVPACGTLACFGGHLARAGVLGITFSNFHYIPELKLEDGSYLDRNAVSVELFGDDLFNGVTTRERNTHWTGHRIVQERLLRREAELLDELDLASNEYISLEDFPNK